MDASLSSAELAAALAGPVPPLVIDVRREPAWHEAADRLPCALRRAPDKVADWAGSLPASRPVVVYCVHGHQVSQGTAASLRAGGRDARFLAGGIEAWREAGGALAGKPRGAGTRWVTRERPQIDRIACPWLIARFVDPAAEFLYVPTADVTRVAGERDAVPFDVAGAALGHHGDRCSFDAFVAAFGLGGDPALERLATIVRGADTDTLALAPESAGLLAISRGLSLGFTDDHAMLAHGMTLYDALHRWAARDAAAGETWTLASR